ncbi:MAG TPA: hypothetical protein VFK02_10820 [Kofleriaceae bacterium]|nr:hypothetical protein [Kofleriaceae bacterium]
MVRFALAVLFAGWSGLGSLGCLDRTGAECRSDSECDDGDLCARNNVCVVASQVRAVEVSWTVNGQPASRTACAASPDLASLEVDFEAPDPDVNPHLGFSPVPCEEGQFHVDKLPEWFESVRVGNRPLGWQFTRIDAQTGLAAVDLVF